MRHLLLFIISIALLVAQEESVSDTTENAPTEAFQDLGLDFGYKGYQWGRSSSELPSLDNFSDGIANDDGSIISMSGILGRDTVDVKYVFSDSGFWKVEFDFKINGSDIDDQMEQYLRIEKDISQVYGNPAYSDHSNDGPTSSYKNHLNVKYSRAFYSSMWNVTPAKLYLILNGLVQQPKTESSILEGTTSFLRLVYYNPDYMKSSDVEKEEEIPSIFEIY